MDEKIDKSNVKKEARDLRKKTKRLEQSRASIKSKSREKGKTIKAYQDRQVELEKNRDHWKAKCKQQEKALIEAENKYKESAALFNMQEEEFRNLLEQFEELKKKFPPKKQR
jgi:predicted  nucleic acid-binding Zn-ribbon protein